MKKTLIICGAVFAMLMLGIALIDFTPLMDEAKQKEAMRNFQDASTIYKNKKAELPRHQTYCIPELKYICTLEGCKTTFPNVFTLLDDTNGKTRLSRCDVRSCDEYPATIDASHEVTEVRTTENHGMIFKIVNIDQSYVEVVTLGTDTWVSHGHCHKN